MSAFTLRRHPPSDCSAVYKIAEHIWRAFIAPLRERLVAEWELLAGVCPDCGDPTEVSFDFMEGLKTTYREIARGGLALV